MKNADEGCDLPQPHRNKMKSFFDFIYMNNISFHHVDGLKYIWIYDHEINVLIGIMENK
jgi:hypothetical protein